MSKNSSYKDPAISLIIDKIILAVGNCLCLLNVLLLVLIATLVVLRYFFNSGGVYLEELQWQIYGIMFITSLSYALVKDAHVRLDLFSSRYSTRTKEFVEVFGITFILLPLLVVVFIHGFTFFENSWSINERSQAPTGLPMLWLFKAFLPIGIFLYGLAAISRAIKGASRLIYKEGEE